MIINVEYTFLGLQDDILSPSARIIAGRPPLAGTGFMDVFLDQSKLDSQVKDGSLPSISKMESTKRAKPIKKKPLPLSFKRKVAPFVEELNKRIKFKEEVN